MMPFWLMEPAQQERIAASRRQAVARRSALCVDWDPSMPWQREMNIRAESYRPLSLWPGVRTEVIAPDSIPATECVISPNGLWMYAEKVLPQHATLATLYGNRQGTVLFDGPVTVPVLHYRSTEGHTWRADPFMSLSPMEYLTLRVGTKLAKGSVVVAGLGLGHQLIEVSKRKQVKELILVERSQELVDWILPRVLPHLGRPLDRVVVGDAFQEVPKLAADVALIDIFKNYGRNSFVPCPEVKKVWCWGSARIGN